jgi:L-malate glycosyltransferase
MRRRRVRYGIHQVLVGATYGDAVTNAALEIRESLRLVGPSEVFAHYRDPQIAGEVRPLHEYTGPPHGILVYHSSIGDPAVSTFLLGRREPIVLVYHNITPPSYFRGLDDRFADLLTLGRRDLRELRHRTRLAIAASEFNARDLETMGFDDVRVVPPVLDPYRLVRMEPDFTVLRHFGLDDERPMLLFVGQQLPHKRVDLLVKAMHVAVSYHGLRAKLAVVGRGDFTHYANSLAEEARELGLENIRFTNGLGNAHLAAMFRRAHALVTASEHEGFCVPIVEAMAFGIPVVARACGAIPETADGAALLMPPEASVEELGEALTAIVEDRELRADLVARGKQRLGTFDAQRSRRQLLDALAEIA